MTLLTRALGATLVVVGVGAYALTGGESVTALLPAVLGLALLGLGVLAGRERLRPHAIHAALVLALLGFIGTVPNLAQLPAMIAGEDVERPVAVAASSLTAIACLAYVALGVRSFIAARRRQPARR